MTADIKAANTYSNGILSRNPNLFDEQLLNLAAAFLELKTDFDAEYEENKTFQQVATDLREQLGVAEAELERERELLKEIQEDDLDLVNGLIHRAEAAELLRDQMLVALNLGKRLPGEGPVETIMRLNAAEQRAAELQARLDRVEQVCNDESRAAWEKFKFGGPAEQGNPYWEGFSDGAEQVLAAAGQTESAATQESGATDGLGDKTAKPAPAAPGESS